MLNKTKNFFKKLFKNILKEKIVFSYDIVEVTPIFVQKDVSSHNKRINLLIPSLHKEHIFGGIATALNIFSNIITKLQDKNINFRIITTDFMEIDKNVVLSYFPMEIHNKKLEIVPFSDRISKKLSISKKDYFFATAWWTAYLTKRIIDTQQKHFKVYHNFIYLIQDYEPNFYNWSSRYVLAENTYHYDNTLAIFNTSLLRDFFKKLDLSFYREYFFEPKLNNSLKKFLKDKQHIKKEKIILLYGRPYTPRNCFELIVMGIKKWVTEYSPSKWEIISVGEKHPNIDLGNMKIVSYGKLSLKDYARLLLKSAIGISLMASPHPSYPPLEMANFGLLTITNKFYNKDLSKWHTNIFSLSSLDPETLSNTLNECVSLFEKNESIGIRGRDLTGFYLSDDDPFPFLDNLIHELLKT